MYYGTGAIDPSMTSTISFRFHLQTCLIAIQNILEGFDIAIYPEMLHILDLDLLAGQAKGTCSLSG
jgi:hypothetical protein